MEYGEKLIPDNPVAEHQQHTESLAYNRKFIKEEHACKVQHYGINVDVLLLALFM